MKEYVLSYEYQYQDNHGLSSYFYLTYFEGLTTSVGKERERYKCWKRNELSLFKNDTILFIENSYKSVKELR